MEPNINDLCKQLRDLGCAVVCFVPDELQGASPEDVENQLIEFGWGVIDSLATEKNDEPTDEEWDWSIK